MADYWKSIDKKFCEICKCWITDNQPSIQIHQNGTRHKINAQNKLREIQKKARSNDKDTKKFNKTLRKIEEAAAAAVALDKDSNPDMSLKIQNYMEQLKEKETELADLGLCPQPSTKKEEKPKIKILHREDKSDTPEVAADKPYLSRFGGWKTVNSAPVSLDLELPSSSYSVASGKSKKPKSSSTTIIGMPVPIFTPKAKPKRKYVFEEKTLAATSLSPSDAVFSSSNKTEPNVDEVEFKKRKFSRSNARQRDAD